MSSTGGTPAGPPRAPEDRPPDPPRAAGILVGGIVLVIGGFIAGIVLPDVPLRILIWIGGVMVLVGLYRLVRNLDDVARARRR